MSEEQGVLGYYDYAHESWKSTQGWKEAILASEFSNFFAGDFHEFTMTYREAGPNYFLWGITDGMAIEEPFEIKTASGEFIATN